MKPLTPRSKGLLALWLLLLSVAFMTMFMLRKCSSPKASSENLAIEKSKGDTIDVAIDYSPVSIYASGDSIGGLNYEILQAVSRLGDIPVKVHMVNSIDKALRLLDEGVFDIVVSDVPVTLDFKGKYLFTEDVYLDRQVLVQYKDTVDTVKPVQSQLDLGGQHVWTVANSPAEARLRNLSAEIGDTIYVESDPQYGAELLYLMTSIGEIKLCVINERLANAMVKRGGKAEIATNISFTQFQAWVLRRDNTVLQERIDSLLHRFKGMPEYKVICDRYLK